MKIPEIKNGIEILKENVDRISSGIDEVDRILKGGFRVGHLTEIYGHPGSGKTQLCLQLCIKCVEDKKCGALFIDTEGGYLSKRLLNMGINWDVWANIHYVRISKDVNELMDFVDNLEENIKNSGKTIKLIVLDSVAFHFRFLSDALKRTKLLNEFGLKLQKCCYYLNIAVKNYFNLKFITTNHTTANIGGHNGGPYIATLGENWGNFIDTRILLTLTKTGERFMAIEKSNSVRENVVKFDIFNGKIQKKLL